MFRFHTGDSHCHSFNDIPPCSWSDVYKVYYAYDIVYRYRFESGGKQHELCEKLLETHFDECSRLRCVALTLMEIPDDAQEIPSDMPLETLTFYPSGDGVT